MQRSDQGPFFISAIGVGVPLPKHQTFEGVGFNVVLMPGGKRPEERKIFLQPKYPDGRLGQLIPLHSQDWAVLTAIYRHNESINYDPREGKLGGDMPILYCDDVMRLGCTKANEKWRIKQGPHALVSTVPEDK